MNLLTTLEPCLRTLSQHCDILPAVGGAMEQMLQPDEEERDDEEITGGEGVVTQYAESPPPAMFEATIPCPAIGRSEQHRFRYFLDGAIRSYFLCMALEGQRPVPVMMSEIGAALLHRRDDGKLDVKKVETETLLLLNLKHMSDAVKNALTATSVEGFRVVDTSEKQRRRGVEDRVRAAGVAKDKMRNLEVELTHNVSRESDAWLVLDGTVEIAQYLATKLPKGNLVGVSKTFSNKLLFRVGRGKARNLTHLLAGLPDAHRTPTFVSLSGSSAFWYLRLRPQGVVDYPLMGVIKVDMPFPEGVASFDSDFITEISRCLVGERTVTPYGRDRRWHSHLYPIYCAENAIRAQFHSSSLLREGLAGKWRGLLRQG